MPDTCTRKEFHLRNRVMNNLTLHRILAFATDYVIIIAYGAILFLIATLFGPPSDVQVHPVMGQAIGFLSLTLPVFLYFFLFEKIRQKATPGKRIFRLQVVAAKRESPDSVFMRNFLKLLPWEVAHAGVHWAVYYDAQGMSTPLRVWLLLIIPQLTVMMYLVSIIATRGRRSFYDLVARTEVTAPHLSKINGSG